MSTGTRRTGRYRSPRPDLPDSRRIRVERRSRRSPPTSTGRRRRARSDGRRNGGAAVRRWRRSGSARTRRGLRGRAPLLEAREATCKSRWPKGRGSWRAHAGTNRPPSDGPAPRSEDRARRAAAASHGDRRLRDDPADRARSRHTCGYHFAKDSSYPRHAPISTPSARSGLRRERAGPAIPDAGPGRLAHAQGTDQLTSYDSSRPRKTRRMAVPSKPKASRIRFSR
jgi:hypothetical protein